MKTIEKEKVCSVEHAGMLDLKIRKLIHNPGKIVKRYINEGMTVIDIGCGPGFFTIEMAKLVGNNGKVVAADLQEGMLEILKKKIENTNLKDRIELHKCPQDKIGITKESDFILLFYMLHEVPDPSAFLLELFSLLKPEGKILIVEPKFHVSKKNFCNSLEMMKTIGFNVINGPKIFFSRSALINKKKK